MHIKCLIMPERNVVPWTAVIGCYARTGDFGHAFYLYNSMLHEGIKPTSITLLIILSWYQRASHVECLHACIVKYGFLGHIALLNSMLNVYGYSLVGDTEELLRLMYGMRSENTWPDHQTYGSLVSAIAKEGSAEFGKVVHGQIVAAGFELDVHLETSLMFMYLKCTALVDMYCKCGDLDSARKCLTGVIERISFHGAQLLLGYAVMGKGDCLALYMELVQSGLTLKQCYFLICSLCTVIMGLVDQELRDNIVAKEISELNHEDAGRYVQLAHSYASMAQWEGVGKTWVQMRELGLKKLPGWSFIDLHGVITTFMAILSEHEDIMLVLKNLNEEISERGVLQLLAANSSIANQLNRLAENIGRKPFKVFIQVNTSGEESANSGVEPDGCVELATKHVISTALILNSVDISSTEDLVIHPCVGFRLVARCRSIEDCSYGSYVIISSNFPPASNALTLTAVTRHSMLVAYDPLKEDLFSVKEQLRWTVQIFELDLLFGARVFPKKPTGLDELKQMESETLENQRRADMALLEAKKMVSQYQKEADKCTSGMGTCEEAREKAEIALEAQRQITSMWELRARHQGWKPELA
ncbi:hypothetical protein HAX54_003524 [Datura stramonium]|uniref:Pentatricopeptide repeat-containing protein n=1 Tax=Datura stramonium TaxID=4076 RepID=A0ABS8RTG5_DATST|nr:hypothetical protein [Datura stramonium]